MIVPMIAASLITITASATSFLSVQSIIVFPFPDALLCLRLLFPSELEVVSFLPFPSSLQMLLLLLLSCSWPPPLHCSVMKSSPVSPRHPHTKMAVECGKGKGLSLSLSLRPSSRFYPLPTCPSSPFLTSLQSATT